MQTTVAGDGVWRPMLQTDLTAVIGIAERAHPSYPEDRAVFTERLRLYPAGCLVLETGGTAVAAYVLSHPWRYMAPPPLNTQLGGLPDPATTYYIHDLATLPEARGRGAGSKVIEKLVQQARSTGLTNMSLIAVNASTDFWVRHGFRTIADPGVDDKLGSYDDQARFMVRDL